MHGELLKCTCTSQRVVCILCEIAGDIDRLQEILTDYRKDKCRMFCRMTHVTSRKAIKEADQVAVEESRGVVTLILQVS